MGIALVSVTSFYLHGLIELSLLVVISPLVIVEPGLFGPVRDFVSHTLHHHAPACSRVGIPVV
ncbi:MAG: hypothetical protein WBL31_05660, partial [Ilumatobacteraceae bacterium]